MTLLGVVSPDDQPVMSERETNRFGRNLVRPSARPPAPAGNPGRTYGTYTIRPPNSSATSRSASASRMLVRLIVGTSWVWAMTL